MKAKSTQVQAASEVMLQVLRTITVTTEMLLLVINPDTKEPLYNIKKLYHVQSIVQNNNISNLIPSTAPRYCYIGNIKASQFF
jgi:hypothetical protein